MVCVPEKSLTHRYASETEFIGKNLVQWNLVNTDTKDTRESVSGELLFGGAISK